MNDSPTALPQAESDYQRQLREMNEALLVSSVRQHELTEQAEKAERALAKALAYGDDIIATLREPFLVLDHLLRVKTANRAFCDVFHVTKEETEQRLVYDLGNGQWDIPALRKLLAEVLSRSQSIHDYEVEHTFPTLGHKIMLLNARPFPPECQHPELILLAMYDISAARQRAEELADLHRRKDEFLAMLSHELRNPLAPIANAVQLLRFQKNTDPTQQQARGIIERQVGQLKHLIEDLLEVSRITTGRIQLHREQVALGGIVDRAVESARPLIGQRQHEFTLSMPPEPIWLYADASRLEQVVVNLLTNAAKYTDTGGHIGLDVLQEGSTAVLRVRDTGVGIASELLPRIFDLFTQAERSLDRAQGGLGIGLSLVQRLVDLHGGSVEASSVLGKGSEFIVRLPVMQTSAAQPPAAPTEATQSTASLQVLVVDDNVDAAESLAMLLKAVGHDVRTAHDGLSAVAAALEYRPDVMLLDIGLPKLNGYEVAKQLRQQPAFQHVLLVAMTGYGQESDRQQAQAAGFDHHLVKPADLSALMALLAGVQPRRVTSQ